MDPLPRLGTPLPDWAKALRALAHELDRDTQHLLGAATTLRGRRQVTFQAHAALPPTVALSGAFNDREWREIGDRLARLTAAWERAYALERSRQVNSDIRLGSEAQAPNLGVNSERER